MSIRYAVSNKRLAFLAGHTFMEVLSLSPAAECTAHEPKPSSVPWDVSYEVSQSALALKEGEEGRVSS